MDNIPQENKKIPHLAILTIGLLCGRDYVISLIAHPTGININMP
jgi:hypothetical protein